MRMKMQQVEGHDSKGRGVAGESLGASGDADRLLFMSCRRGARSGSGLRQRIFSASRAKHQELPMHKLSEWNVVSWVASEALRYKNWSITCFIFVEVDRECFWHSCVLPLSTCIGTGASQVWQCGG